jgi:hypothetical protein
MLVQMDGINGGLEQVGRPRCGTCCQWAVQRGWAWWPCLVALLVMHTRLQQATLWAEYSWRGTSCPVVHQAASLGDLHPPPARGYPPCRSHQPAADLC